MEILLKKIENINREFNLQIILMIMFQKDGHRIYCISGSSFKGMKSFYTLGDAIFGVDSIYEETKANLIEMGVV